MKSKISRRSFLRNIAAAGSGAAALGLLAGCSSSSTAASSGSTVAAEDKYTPGTYSASKTISYSEIGVSMTFDANSITACEITSSGEQDLLTDDKKTAMAKAIVEGQSADVDAVTSCTLVASVGAIQECVADCIAQATGTEVEKPETTEVTGRVPGYCGPGDWLGEAPADPDKYEDAGTYDVVIVGGGVSGMYAAVTAAERGHDVTVWEKGKQIGGQLKSGIRHDGRAPDYDDWTLNCDILFWHKALGCALELSSMGIRVDPAAMTRQLEAAGCPERAELPFHKMLLEGKLPLTMGGGIGQSRLCMLLLGKAHIGEVQVSLWDAETKAVCERAGVQLL